MNNKFFFSILLLFFYFVSFSQNIDSIVNSKPKTNKELINIARELIYKEVTNETPDINKIRLYQNYLNENKKNGLLDSENLMLYYFIQDWYKALNQIHLIYYRSITGREHNTVRNLSYTTFKEIDRNNTLENLQKSNLTNEKKDFLFLYFRLISIWKLCDSEKIITSKSKDMIKEYYFKHPDSSYNPYLQVPLNWFQNFFYK